MTEKQLHEKKLSEINYVTKIHIGGRKFTTPGYKLIAFDNLKEWAISWIHHLMKQYCMSESNLPIDMEFQGVDSMRELQKIFCYKINIPKEDRKAEAVFVIAVLMYMFELKESDLK